MESWLALPDHDQVFVWRGSGRQLVLTDASQWATRSWLHTAVFPAAQELSSTCVETPSRLEVIRPLLPPLSVVA